jgi:hypothetical protein
MTTDNTFTTLSSGRQALIINDFIDLFKSNQRGYGIGEFEGARFDEDKNKWYPGGVRWVWGKTEEQQWHDHLSGVRLLGQGVLCDDNMVWYSCLDIDSYDIDYTDEMAKIKRNSLPLVVFRTKSGGLRVTIFFSEPIEADLVIPKMKRMASLLGYAGCEVFPKQTKLDVANGDCPSWIYMPYGGQGNSPEGTALFPEQGCMNEGGNLMMMEEFISYAKDRRVSKNSFLGLFNGEDKEKTNGRTNGKRHRQGAWVQEESAELTITTMFWNGPPCMWTIAHNRCHDYQNNFLLDVATFLKKKYTENWDKALEWVNYNVLQPVGDRERLNSIIKRTQGHDYEYMCKTEPICSHCNPYACRNQEWGVGKGKGGDHFDLGATIIESEPHRFIINIGDKRVMFTAEELIRHDRYKTKCLEYNATIPAAAMKRADWENFLNKSLETATRVKPTHVIRSNADELDILMQFFKVYIPTFLRIGEKEDDKVRIKVDEKRVYFKEQRLLDWCRQTSWKLVSSMRLFIDNKCEHHGQGPGGFRGWWRSTYSISFDLLDEDVVEKWLNMVQEANHAEKES